MIKMRTKEEKDSEQWATNSSKVHVTNKISCQKTLLLTPYLQAVMKVIMQSLILNIFFFHRKHWAIFISARRWTLFFQTRIRNSVFNQWHWNDNF